jgi:signal transduction histidine kinase
LLYRYRVNHLLKQERLRFRIASDLHDDVGTNLSSILVTSQIMQRQTRLSDEVLLHVKDIQSIAAETQDALRDIVWMLNPGNDYLGDFVLKMKDTAERLLQNMRVRFTVPGGSLLEKVSIDFKRNVFLIFKESLNNIVRHSQASEVLIEIAYDSGTFVLQIHDNGQGFSMGEHGTGIGLSNLQRRASQIGGTVQVVSRPGWGTTVRLEVKNHANAQ